MNMHYIQSCYNRTIQPIYFTIDMTPKRQVLNIRLNQWKGARGLRQTNTRGRVYNGDYTNGKGHSYLDKQMHLDADTMVSFVIQSGHVSKGRSNLRVA